MSTASVTQPDERLLTAEEYAALTDDRRTELVKGKVVEMPQPGFLHGKVQARIARLMANYVEDHDLGHVLTESGVVTTRDPDTVRGPDVSFYSYERIPKESVPRVYAEAPPEIVFEVRSPDDRVGEVLRKAGEYLTAGTLCVCVVDPRRRSAVVYGEDDSVTVLSENDTLLLPPPLAGWTPRVGDFFPE
ncbi:MAG TPA: Uma2 family endonuclease [Planctomycetaceae bacterium]